MRAGDLGDLFRRAGGDDLAENHEINVTPFIDVMLVLLIIFMVAAPLATVDIKVDLPASTAKPVPRPEKPVFLSVKADQNLYVGDDQVQRDQLGAILDAKTKGDKAVEIEILQMFARQERGCLQALAADDDILVEQVLHLPATIVAVIRKVGILLRGESHSQASPAVSTMSKNSSRWSAGTFCRSGCP